MIAIKTVLKYLSPVMVLYLVVAGFEEYKSIYDYVITNLSSIIYFIGEHSQYPPSLITSCLPVQNTFSHDTKNASIQ